MQKEVSLFQDSETLEREWLQKQLVAADDYDDDRASGRRIFQRQQEGGRAGKEDKM